MRIFTGVKNRACGRVDDARCVGLARPGPSQGGQTYKMDLALPATKR